MAPDQQLIADLLAAGASSAVQDSPAGNTPLLLAVKLGGPAGLVLAKLLLLQQSGGVSCSHVSAAGLCAGADAGGSAFRDRCSIDASNAAGETALGLAAAAALAGKPAPTPAASKAAAAAAAAMAAAAQSSAYVAQQLLGVVLSGQPTVPEQLGATLLQAGLLGKLPDEITAQVSGPWHAIMHNHNMMVAYAGAACSALFALVLLWKHVCSCWQVAAQPLREHSICESIQRSIAQELTQVWGRHKEYDMLWPCMTELLSAVWLPAQQLVALLPAEAVTLAAAAVSLPQPLTFQSLLGLRLYRTAVAQLVKTSGKEPGAPQVKHCACYGCGTHRFSGSYNKSHRC
jgi:hypothetical protein